MSLRRMAYYSCLLSYCNLANIVDDSKSPILKLASYFIIMVRGMDQDGPSEKVGDRHGSNKILPDLSQLLKILQIIKQTLPGFCIPADFYSSKVKHAFQFSKNYYMDLSLFQAINVNLCLQRQWELQMFWDFFLWKMGYHLVKKKILPKKYLLRELVVESKILISSIIVI